MAKLKLGAIEDDKPVKVTIELPAALHRDLVAYAQALARETAQGAVEPAKLIAPMLARFMATDRVFAKTRRSGQAPDRRQGITLSQNLEETRQGRVFVVRSPMGGIAKSGGLRAVAHFPINHPGHIGAGARFGQQRDPESGADQAL